MGSNLNRMSYVDEGMEELSAKTLDQALRFGQSLERREIFDLVRAALEAEANTQNEAAEETDSE